MYWLLVLLPYQTFGATDKDDADESVATDESFHLVEWPPVVDAKTTLIFASAIDDSNDDNLQLALKSSEDSDSIEEENQALPLRSPPDFDLPRDIPEYEFDDMEYDLPVETVRQTPLGFSGPSGILPKDFQQNSHFVPMPDRWRSGFPQWDRYGPETRVFPDGDPFEDDTPYARGAWWNPYRQNILKGDYPVLGQNTFFNFTALSMSTIEFRQVPTPTGPFESSQDPFQEEFFGDPSQFFFNQNFAFSFELFHGDAGFRPFDWRVKITPIFNLNYLDVEELGVVNPDVRAGTTRYRTFVSLEEFYLETKIADTSPNYDFVSARVGSQPFVSDFRGFLFADTNLATRVFGTRHANRDQYNFVWLSQWEKDTNSLLNTWEKRPQNVLIANYFRQDFIWPGYTTQLSFHYNQDRGKGLVFDKNDFLVRPDAVGVFAPHRVDVVYLGWAGDGHINRFNINHAFYLAYGQDDLNPLSGRKQAISAQMGAIELSYDRDWMRFRSSLFWASGDDDISDGRAEGFDAIFDNPNFAGGEFSYWQRQSIRLQGVNLVDRFSLVPHLRSSKFQGQTNFVNPGLWLVNFGIDADISPRVKMINNLNFLYFDHTEVLEQFVFQSGISRYIGTDISSGLEYRPLLNDNLLVIGGVSGLITRRWFRRYFRRIGPGRRQPVCRIFGSQSDLLSCSLNIDRFWHLCCRYCFSGIDCIILCEFACDGLGCYHDGSRE